MDITVRPFYQRVENEIRQPHRGIFVSAYLLRWVPEIGAGGLVLLLWLRMTAASCRQTTLVTLAQEVGTSVATLKRTLSRLRRAGFVRWGPAYQYRPDLRKRVRCGIVLEVQMDDPLRPEDQRLAEDSEKNRIPWDPNMAPPPGMILVRNSDGEVQAIPMEQIARVIRMTGATLSAMYDLDVPGNDGRLEELEEMIGEPDLAEDLGKFFSADLARRLAERGERSPEEKERIRAWIAYTRSQGNLRNPAGFLRRQIESGNWPPGWDGQPRSC